jgi:predicted DNA-binding ribbon-helix-helix protein
MQHAKGDKYTIDAPSLRRGSDGRSDRLLAPPSRAQVFSSITAPTSFIPSVELNSDYGWSNAQDQFVRWTLTTPGVRPRNDSCHEVSGRERSVVIAGHKKSVSLEEAFWKSLKAIASYQDMTVSTLLAAIDSERCRGPLSSAIRLFVINFYREQLEIQERNEAIQEAIDRSVPGFS